MRPASRQHKTTSQPAGPEATVTRFYNSIFAHTRNWPRAYSCLSPEACRKFDSGGGLCSFADYWEDKLSFLEELVRKRHVQYPYTHRSCFSLDRMYCAQRSEDRAVVEIELAEIHVAHERMAIRQTKEVSRQGHEWLLDSGELEGNLNENIIVRDLRRRRVRRR